MGRVDYFNGCNSIRCMKGRYKKLCKKHHPDVGGSTEVMADINRQRDEWIAAYEERNSEKNFRDYKYGGDNKKRHKDYSDYDDDMFPFGKHNTEKISECGDASYMYWLATEGTGLADSYRCRLLNRAISILEKELYKYSKEAVA